MPVPAAVLTGGASRRMGRDKALLPVGGTAMVRRVITALGGAGYHPIVAIGGDRPALEALGVTVVDDSWPGEGPLGGILTALLRTEGPVVVVACDLPWIEPATVRCLVATAGAERVDVIVARSDRREPLCACWQPSARPHVVASFMAGERAVHRVLAGLRVAEVQVDPRTLVDADTPADLAADLPLPEP